MSDNIPDLAFSLDLQHLQTWVQHEDGQPVLHMNDGRQHVTIKTETDGPAIAARAAAAALGGAVRQLARHLDDEAEPEWWTAPEITTPGDAWPR